MYDERKFKNKIMDIVQNKGYSSIMNNTKWKELQTAVNDELSFPPPYQIKYLHEETPTPLDFQKDVWYWGDWEDEVLSPFFHIEWICVRPRYEKHIGMLVKKEIVDETVKFLALLQKFNIPYEEKEGSYFIYGYK